MDSSNYRPIELLSPPTTHDHTCTSALITSSEGDDQVTKTSVYQKKRKRLWGRSIRKFLAYFMVVALILLPVAMLGMKSLGPCSYNTILSFNKNEIVPYLTTGNATQYHITPDDNSTSFQIFLFGDSLINKPYMNLDLEGKIRSYLPQFDLEITNIASNGCKISDMRSKLVEVLEGEVRPDAILLYWDSDVSDVDESKMSASEVDDLRSKYKDDLSYTLSELASYLCTALRIPLPNPYSFLCKNSTCLFCLL